MRGLRTTLFLFVVLVGLSVYIYLYEWSPASILDIRAARAKALNLALETISEVTVKAETGEKTTLTKTDGEWRITSPVAANADSAAITAITRDLANLEILHVVDENPSDLNQYGLDPPRVELLVHTSDNAGPRRLLIGDKTPVGENLYTQVASESRVLLIAAAFDETFNKSTWALRDRRVLPIDRVGIESLEVHGAGRDMALVKHELEWQLTRPLHTAADLGVVSELVTGLTSAEMQSLIESDATDLHKYGFQKPLYTVTVGVGSSRARLEIGSQAESSTVYARDVSRPLIFTIETSFVDMLKKPVSEYRRKDVFAFAAQDADVIEVTRNGQTSIFQKTKPAGKDAHEAWRRVSPNPRDVQFDRMEAVLSGLSFLRAVTFVTNVKVKAAMTAPDVLVRVRYGNPAKEEGVRFAAIANAWYAARDEWPDFATLDSAACARVLDSLNTLEK